MNEVKLKMFFFNDKLNRWWGNFYSKGNCCGCGACEQICPKKCISMLPDEEGFLYPVVDSTRCIKCGLCERVCQYSNKNKENKILLEQYYFIHNDEDVRNKSSSGGFFICLAEEVIKRNGVVFGACFDENFDVVISYAETLDECWKFVGSKYVQAKVGHAYRYAKKFLQEKRLVLFSGTPCQINGLQHYLGDCYENLLKLDFTCHAIPSPLIWNKYLKTIKGKYFIQSVNFRDKEISGWNNYGLTIIGYHNNMKKKLVAEGNRQNLYMRGFLQYLYDRPSCSNCVSRNFFSTSDIMIGDFWNVDKYHSDSFFNDNKGVSIVLVLSEKGRNFFKKVKNCGKEGGIPVEEIEMNASHDCILKSAPKHACRKIFFLLNQIGIPLKINIRLCLDLLGYVNVIYQKIKSLKRKKF